MFLSKKYRYDLIRYTSHRVKDLRSLLHILQGEKVLLFQTKEFFL